MTFQNFPSLIGHVTNLLAVAAFGSLLGGSLQAQTPVFEAAPDYATLLVQANDEQDAISFQRTRLAGLNTELLASGNSPLRRPSASFIQQPASEFSLNLFSDAAYVGHTEKFSIQSMGIRLSEGGLKNIQGGRFVIAEKDGVLAGFVRDPNRGDYYFGYRGHGIYSIHQAHADGTSPVAECGVDNNHIAHLIDPSMALEPVAPPQATTAPAGTLSQLDILWVYTTDAKNRAGGDAGMMTRIAVGMANCNNAYANSQIDAIVNLVHAEEVQYTSGSTSGTDLGRIRAKNDGFMDNVHALRDLHRADYVSLVNTLNDVCGVAYVLGSPTGRYPLSGESFAFGVTVFNCVQSYTFAHELGHNLGCYHDRDNSGTGGVFPFNYGHRFTSGGLKRTVMAYAPGTRIDFFSNPNVSFNGVPTGVPDSEDNAQVINFTSKNGKDFRLGDANAELTVFNAQILEGQSGFKTLSMLVGLNVPSTQLITADYLTQDGTATADVDYIPRTGQLVFQPGITNQTVSIQIIGDLNPEQDENFDLLITNAVNASIATGIAVATIRDDDSGDLIGISDTVIVEGDTGTKTATVTVEVVTGPTTQDIQFDFYTADISAQAGADYTSRSGSRTITAGQTNTTINIPILGDRITEDNEFFYVVLTNSVNANLFQDIGIVTIADNDGPPPNDQCIDATLVTTSPYSTVQLTDTATTTGDANPPCIAGFGKGVWYEFVPAVNGLLTVDTVGSVFDTGIGVYTNTCSELYLLACDDDSAGSGNASLTFRVEARNRYLVLFGGKNSAGGELHVNFNLKGDPPIITNLSSTALFKGGTLEIQGQNFSILTNDNVVTLGPVRATVTDASPTSLTVQVPSGLSYGPAKVLVGGFSSASTLSVAPAFPSTGQLDTNTLASPVQFNGGSNLTHLVTGDFDLDGRPDIAALDRDGLRIRIWRNTSLPNSISPATFTAQPSLQAGSDPRDLITVDVDNDGKLDLVVADAGEFAITVYRNQSATGAIGFSNAIRMIDPDKIRVPTGVAAGDLDGDGKPELVASAQGAGWIVVLPNNTAAGSITPASFLAPLIYVCGPQPDDVLVADLDGDHRLDLAVVNGLDHPTAGNLVTILRNLGNPGPLTLASMSPRVSLPVPARPQRLEAADLDGDGKLDLVSVHQGAASLNVRPNLSSPGSLSTNSFAPNLTLPTGVSTTGVQFGDLNGDGKTDILTALLLQNRVAALANMSTAGNIQFAPALTFPTPNGPLAVLAADLNQNGKSDLAVGTRQGGMIVLKNRLRSNPNLVWPASTNLIYGDLLGSSQLNANGGQPGTVSYSHPLGARLNAGTSILTAFFTPLDTDEFNIVQSQLAFQVSPRALTIRPNSVDIHFGDSVPTVTGNLEGLLSVDPITAEFSANLPVNAPVGKYPITVVLSDPQGRLTNYATNAISGEVTVLPTVQGTSRHANGLDVTFVGEAGVTYNVEESTDLIRWDFVRSFVATGASDLVDNLPVDPSGLKFYRVVPVVR